MDTYRPVLRGRVILAEFEIDLIRIDQIKNWPNQKLAKLEIDQIRNWPN